MGTATTAVLACRKEQAVTVEDRHIIDLSDIKAVRFECSACAAAVTLLLDSWRDPNPRQCPGCGVPWGTSPQAFETSNRLRLGIQGMKALMTSEGAYRLRLELDRPKN